MEAEEREGRYSGMYTNECNAGVVVVMGLETLVIGLSGLITARLSWGQAMPAGSSGPRYPVAWITFLAWTAIRDIWTPYRGT